MNSFAKGDSSLSNSVMKHIGDILPVALENGVQNEKPKSINLTFRTAPSNGGISYFDLL